MPAPDCATCASTCCRGWVVVVSAADVARLGGDGCVVPRPDLEPGHVGALKQTAAGACVFLGPDGCSVYDRRPEVCRTFGAVTCDRYQPDARKQLGLVRLRRSEGDPGPALRQPGDPRED